MWVKIVLKQSGTTVTHSTYPSVYSQWWYWVQYTCHSLFSEYWNLDYCSISSIHSSAHLLFLSKVAFKSAGTVCLQSLCRFCSIIFVVHGLGIGQPNRCLCCCEGWGHRLAKMKRRELTFYYIQTKGNWYNRTPCNHSSILLTLFNKYIGWHLGPYICMPERSKGTKQNCCFNCTNFSSLWFEWNILLKLSIFHNFPQYSRIILDFYEIANFWFLA